MCFNVLRLQRVNEGKLVKEEINEWRCVGSICSYLLGEKEEGEEREASFARLKTGRVVV